MTCTPEQSDAVNFFVILWFSVSYFNYTIDREYYLDILSALRWLPPQAPSPYVPGRYVLAVMRLASAVFIGVSFFFLWLEDQSTDELAVAAYALFAAACLLEKLWYKFVHEFAIVYHWCFAWVARLSFLAAAGYLAVCIWIVARIFDKPGRSGGSKAMLIISVVLAFFWLVYNWMMVRLNNYAVHFMEDLARTSDEGVENDIFGRYNYRSALAPVPAYRARGQLQQRAERRTDAPGKQRRRLWRDALENDVGSAVGASVFGAWADPPGADGAEN